MKQPEITLIHFNNLITFCLGNFQRISYNGMLLQIAVLLEDSYPGKPQGLPVYFKIECRPECRGVPCIVQDYPVNSETCGSKAECPYTTAGINKTFHEPSSNTLFDHADFRIISPGELNMNERLLFVENKSTTPEGKDICPYIATCKELVYSGNRVEI